MKKKAENSNSPLKPSLDIAGVSGSYFDSEKLSKALEKAKNIKIKYAIGIDTYDKNNLAYCLSRTIDKKFEIILCKRMKDEKEFKEETENLSKYFNATIFREV